MSSSLSPAAAWPRVTRLALGRRWVTAGAFVLVVGTGFAQGGYFPGSWGWPTLGAAWAAGLAALARDRTALSRTAAATAVLLAALTGWTLLSVAWSIDVTQTALEAERGAVYASALLAALLWAGRRPERLLHGTWAAIAVVSGWGLLTRLVPDRFHIVSSIGGYRLSVPIGYWNTLGLMAGMGALLALGLAARAQTTRGRALAAFSLPPLLATLYFTYSRGAWVAFGCGLVATFLLDRRRLQLGTVALALAPWPALALLWASTSKALTTEGYPPEQMAAEGHRVLLRIVVVSLASALVAAALRPLEPKLVLPARLRPWAAGLLALVVAAAVVAASERYGSPPTLVRNGWHTFAAAPTAGGPNLNTRLFHLYGNGRVVQWRVAWHDVLAHPWLGSGAGSYESYWDRHRPVPLRVRDVHNLYLETLAELGPIGLLLLAGVLVLPLAAAVRDRGRPLTAAAFGAYVAYLLHAGVDWDWEIVSATLAALFCGAALLSAPRLRRQRRSLAGRTAVLAAAAVLAATGLYTIATRLPLERLGTDAAHGDWIGAERNARRASALAPWSSEPWVRLGEAELNAGRPQEALLAFRRAAFAEPGEWLPWHDLARASVGVEQAAAQARARALNPLEP